MRDESQFALSPIRPDRGTRMQKTDPHADVVVGLDFSSGEAAAIDAAAFEAARRHVPLVLLAAIDQANRPATSRRDRVPLIAEDSATSRAWRRTSPTSTRPWTSVNGRPRRTGRGPVGRLRNGSLLVLCSRGMSGVGQFLSGRSPGGSPPAAGTGPVGQARRRAASRVPGRPRRGGVDGTERSSAAVEFGFREASLRGTSLAAVNVWGRPHPKGLNAGRDYSTERDNWLHEMNEDADRALSESLAGLGPAFPDVTVEHVVRHALTVPDTLLSVGREREPRWWWWAPVANTRSASSPWVPLACNSRTARTSRSRRPQCVGRVRHTEHRDGRRSQSSLRRRAWMPYMLRIG